MKQTDQVQLDVTGHKCPMPILRLRRCLAPLAPGVEVEVTATDPMTQLDVPHFCHEAGHDLLSQKVKGGQFIFLVKKAGDEAR